LGETSPSQYDWLAGINAGAVFYLLMVLGRIDFGDDSLGEAARSSLFEGVFYTVFMTFFSPGRPRASGAVSATCAELGV
jgi:hypothetical protein